MGCGLWSVEVFQNLVLELVFLGSWFGKFIILKSVKFSNV